MKTTKTMIRLFTIADYEEEEAFLRRQHQAGYRLKKFTLPCFYKFEACEPEDVVYRLDFRESEENDETYDQMFADYGWEHMFSSMGWHYFRKAASETEENPEIFSDNHSKIDLIQRILKYRMIPLILIFLGCILPNVTRVYGKLGGRLSDVFTIFWAVVFLLYVFLFLHCWIRFQKLKKKYANEIQ